ncbi:hypothetical protein [Flavobacterium sp. CF136]|uniref:hypothetical protein n=1 Tax=Flavobacterium sp. (strain CF136) TaxID=1144313 RepID=UPI0002719F0E|nr:hypothetical protein [Flavobacterium sp. CF136]EJL66300.1 hypothetical protein PMI10_00648 [Flavobacterium sp. CF136]
MIEIVNGRVFVEGKETVDTNLIGYAVLDVAENSVIKSDSPKKIVNPKINTKVVHSKTKDAFNVIGTSLGNKYKIARIPYIDIGPEKKEALNHALFISMCFNNSDSLMDFLNKSTNDNSLQEFITTK